MEAVWAGVSSDWNVADHTKMTTQAFKFVKLDWVKSGKSWMLRQEDRFLYFIQEELIEKQQYWKYIFKQEFDFVFAVVVGLFCFGRHSLVM